jgi:hypothetical protein
MNRLELKAAGQSDVARVLLTGRCLRKALHAIDAEWRGWLALSERESAKADVPRGFSFVAPENFVIPKPLDPDFPWNFFGHLDQA